jgi:hypothetical protein
MRMIFEYQKQEPNGCAISSTFDMKNVSTSIAMFLFGFPRFRAAKHARHHVCHARITQMFQYMAAR